MVIAVTIAEQHPGVIGTIAIFWMLVHSIFAIILFIVAKRTSITRRSALVHMILNFVTLILFFIAIVSITAGTGGDNAGILFVVLWFIVALVGPVVMLIISLFDRQYSKKANLQHLASTLQ